MNVQSKSNSQFNKEKKDYVILKNMNKKKQTSFSEVLRNEMMKYEGNEK